MSQLTPMLPMIIVTLMVATLATLIFGVFSMGRGGDFSRKWSNKLMRLRVLFQGIAVLLAALFVILSVT